MQHLLVTGGAGFIGSNFIHYLFEESDFEGRVINLDALTYAGNPLNLSAIAHAHPDRYVFERGDIADQDTVERIFDQYGIDSICHFAAESHVDRSIVAPDAFVRTNILGTWNLIDAARRRKDHITLFHHVSTDEVYGSLGDTGKFLETTPYAPTSPYSASKASSDHLVRAYGHTFGLPFTLSNCSNNYGPYQFPEKLIPLMILNGLAGKPLPVYGDGSNVRDWLYVRDHAVAIWNIMRDGRRGETYNVGGCCEKANLEVVTTLADLLDELAPGAPTPRRELITFVKDRPGHDWRYAIDCDKIANELGWRPEETFEAGLRKTVQWYLDHHDWVESVQTGAYRDWMQHQYGGDAK